MAREGDGAMVWLKPSDAAPLGSRPTLYRRIQQKLNASKLGAGSGAVVRAQPWTILR